MRNLFSLVLVSAFVFGVAGEVDAQERHYTVGIYGNSGVSMGPGQDGPVILQSPIAGEVGVRTWTDLDPEIVTYMGLRLEVADATAVGLIPRIEYNRAAGATWFYVRPFAGLPFFFSPFSLAGLEAGLSLDFRMGDFSIVLSMMADVYFWGSDLPKDSTLFMFNGSLGFELEL